MYLTRKNTILLIGGVLTVMLIVAPILFFILRNGDSLPAGRQDAKNENVLENQAPVTQPQVLPKEQKPTRTQDEIWMEYTKNINDLLNLVNTSEESVEVILFKMEAVFLSITVPGEERDLYLKTFLQIQKLKSDGTIDNKEKLREHIVPLLSALLDRSI